MRKPRIPEDEVTQVYERYASGTTLAEIADRYNCDPCTVRNTFLRKGMKLRPRRHTRALTTGDEELVVAAYQGGKTLKELAITFGCSDGTIKNTLARHKVQSRSRNQGGINHPSWKGGRIVNSYGYALRWIPPDDPLASMITAAGYVPEHRLTMARSLERPLTTSETVHHIDGDKLNNALSNLELRSGNHGQGVLLQCADCGSHNIASQGLTQ